MAPTPEVDAEAITTATCPECGVDVVPIGKQTANMALGSHRWKAHQVKGSHARRSKKATREAKPPTRDAGADDTDAAPLAMVHNILEPIAGGKGAPTAHQLTGALGKGYGYLQLWRVSRIADRDPRLTDDQRVEMIERVAPSTDTCESVASPFARVIARTGLNRTAGRAVVENIDILDCVVALAETERGIAAYAREVRAVLSGQAAGTVATLASAPPAADNPAGAVIPPGAAADYYGYSDGPRSPAPKDGVVVDASMVAASMGVNLPPLPADVNRGGISPSMEVAP